MVTLSRSRTLAVSGAVIVASGVGLAYSLVVG